ncbi:MAG: trypsin-like peptidase domain-containing protein [Staphylothermus sp.]|nr:trypsin-like peptidase domain-containing protein [Staphylothermus sp.]
MRPTYLLLILIIVILVAPLVVAEELYSSMWDKGVVVVLYGSQYGTGWWVSDYYLVTAAHVVNYQSNIAVTIMHGDYVSKANVIYIDRVHDVAVLRASTRPAEQYIWSLAFKDPDKSQQIFVIGYPFELYKIVGDLQKMSADPRIAEGIVAWVYPDKQLFEFQASTDAGNSGGPIVDVSGNVVGLVSFAVKGEAASMYYGTSVSAIKDALTKAGVKYRTGLSSMLGSSGITSSSQVIQPAVIAAITAGTVALLTTVMVLPMVKARKR